MHLTEIEDEKLLVKREPLKEVVSKGERCLLLKLHTNRPYNREAFKLMVKKICRPSNAVRFLELGASIIMAVFDSIKDKERVLRESPWNFDKNLCTF